MIETKLKVAGKNFYELFNPKIVLSDFHQAEPGWKSENGNYIQTDFDFWFVKQGKGAVKIDGNWVDFRKNDFIIMKPGQLYQQEKTGSLRDQYDIYFIHFLPFGERNSMLDDILSDKLPQKISFNYSFKLIYYFRDIYETFSIQQEGYQLHTKACMLNILNLLMNSIHSVKRHDIPISYPRLQLACNYIEDHYNDDLKLKEIAQSSGLSPSYLSYLFRQYFFHSPIDYQIELRLMKAKIFMAEGNSVSQTAYEVGFHSIFYFSRLFKKRYAMSPSDFIRMCKKWQPEEKTLNS